MIKQWLPVHHGLSGICRFVSTVVRSLRQGSGKTDDQKLVHKLERENDKLRTQIRDAEQLRMRSAQTTVDDVTSPAAADSQELQVSQYYRIVLLFFCVLIRFLY